MLKIKANDVKKIIKVFSWICKKNFNPIYNRITLSCDVYGNQYVSGRNPDTALFFKLSGTTETVNPESVTVDFVPFYNALKTANQDYTVLATEGLAKFSSNDCALGFNLDTKDEHVVIKGSLRNENSKPFSTVDSLELSKALSTVKYALSTNDRMESLKGFHFNNYEGKLNIFATDTHRLAVAIIDGNTPKTAEEESFIVLPAIEKYLREMTESQVSLYNTDECTISFESDSWGLLISKIDGQSPSYRQVIPSGYEYGFKANRYELIKGLTGLMGIVNQSTQKVVFGKENGKIILRVPNTNTYSAITDSDAVGHMSFAVDCSYMMDTLKSLDTEYIIVYSGGYDKQLLVKSGNTTHILATIYKNGWEYCVCGKDILNPSADYCCEWCEKNGEAIRGHVNNLTSDNTQSKTNTVSDKVSKAEVNRLLRKVMLDKGFKTEKETFEFLISYKF